MSEAQIQAIKDVIKMTPRLNIDCLNSIKVLMEKAIESELLRLEPTVLLDNMDITEKVMYLDYLMESKDTKEQELKNAVSFEEVLKREGLTFDDLQEYADYVDIVLNAELSNRNGIGIILFQELTPFLSLIKVTIVKKQIKIRLTKKEDWPTTLVKLMEKIEEIAHRFHD